jgi:hypothetical protein
MIPSALGFNITKAGWTTFGEFDENFDRH